MKIAYVLPIDIVRYHGILNKVSSQISAWEKNKNTVKVFLVTSRDLSELDSTALPSINDKKKIAAFKSKKLGLLPIDLLKDWIGLSSMFSEVLEAIAEFSPDIVYARSALYQPFYGKLGSKYKLVLELNTDMASEYKLQSKQSIKYFLRYIYFLFTKEKLFKGVSGLAAVTFGIAKATNIKDKELGVFPNSIDIFQYPDYPNKSINRNIVFIGSPDMPWQGFDILIKLAERLPAITFNLIGVSKINIEVPSNVIFHGFMKNDEYLSLLYSATACIGTLALFRKNMEEACPLKVREYVACCKPVILPYKDTAFESLGYPDWVLQLPNSEKGILSSSGKVEAFVDKCNAFNINKEDVKKYVHVDDIEGRRLRFFEKVMNSAADSN
ncbi:glycosyltransferase family protein [Croceivirga radicis]|uniref:glycosyltransferase n=1 Tax=Croceivirga radicis TaxID=1929488 RepID=UPI000255ACD8|nr:glycosyltransferase [Croceivirga radicis]